MAYILSSIPYFRCWVAPEFIYGDERDVDAVSMQAIAHAITCQPGRTVGFHVVFIDRPLAGVAYCWLPVKALRHTEAPFAETIPPPLAEVAPWDCFSDRFTVVQLEFLNRMRCRVLSGCEGTGRYHATIDFTGSSLAEDPQQHKQLHIIMMDCGEVALMPNNRLLFDDPALWESTKERPPGIRPQTQEFMGE